MKLCGSHLEFIYPEVFTKHSEAYTYPLVSTLKRSLEAYSPKKHCVIGHSN